MNRRVFLKVTGVVAAAGAIQALPSGNSSTGRVPSGVSAGTFAVSVSPAGTPLTVREAGTYRISGLVRLNEPRVEIGGFTHTQWISWSDSKGVSERLSSFTAFEHFDSADAVRTIQIRGGQLESVSAVLMDFA